MIDYQPPHATELEKAVLGAAMLEEDATLFIVDAMKEDDFYLSEHKHIFNAICQAFNEGKPIDLLTISDTLRKADTLDAIGGTYYLTEVSTAVASSAHIVQHVKIIQEKAIARELITASSGIVKQSYEQTTDVFDVVDEAQNIIGKALDRLTAEKEASLKDGVGEIYHKIKQGESTKGLLTQINFIDNELHGLHAGNLIIIAARPGMGKTAFALQLCSNIMSNGNAVGFISLEMNEEELGQRMLSQNSGVKFEDVRLNQIQEKDLPIIESTLRKLEGYQMQIRDITAGLTAIKAIAKKWRIKQEIKCLVIDYLQLMDAKGDTREQAVSSISRGLKLLAKELKIPIVVLSQLNRECEKRPNKVPQLSDLRESGAIEQDADSVIFLHRPEVYGLELDSLELENIKPEPNSVKNLCVAIVPKNRHGQGNLFRSMRFDGSVQQFTNYVQRTDPNPIPYERRKIEPSTDLEDSPF